MEETTAPKTIFTTEEVPQTPALGQDANAPVSPPPAPKKAFPKSMVFIFGAVLLLGVLGFAVFKIFFGSPKTAGEIIWWGLWEDENIVASLIAEYQTKNPKVKITYVKQSPKDYRERLTNALAKGQGPDIFRFHNTWVPMFKNELDALPSSVINPSDFSKTFYPVAVSDLTLGSGIVGIPLEYEGLGLYINEDIFSKAGKTPPTTWDELRTLAKELTVKDDQGIITQSGVALGRTENVDHWQEIIALLMIQNGVDLTNPKGKNAEDALKFFSIFSTVDGVWDATLPPSTTAFAAGKLAMFIAPSWRAFEVSLANPDLKYIVVGIPQVAKDNPADPDTTYATYWVEGVWARSKNKSIAWDFLKFLSEKENMQKMYQNASRVRLFGEPYSRADMAQILFNHDILGGIVKQAPGASSWYLSSRTFDGPTGINTLLSKYFEDALNAVASGKPADKALETVASGVTQVLTQYKIVGQ